MTNLAWRNLDSGKYGDEMVRYYENWYALTNYGEECIPDQPGNMSLVYYHIFFKSTGVFKRYIRVDQNNRARQERTMLSKEELLKMTPSIRRALEKLYGWNGELCADFDDVVGCHGVGRTELLTSLTNRGYVTAEADGTYPITPKGKRALVDTIK